MDVPTLYSYNPHCPSAYLHLTKALAFTPSTPFMLNEHSDKTPKSASDEIKFPTLAQNVITNAQLSLRDVLQADKNRRNGASALDLLTEKMKPKLHLLGMKRSGKSSILRTVFHRENASETLYLESTREVNKEHKNSVVDFDVWDHPAVLDVNDPQSSPFTMLSSPGSLIWIIDAQDEYYQAIDYLAGTFHSFAKTSSGNAPTLRLPAHITVEVFIHKTDGLSNDFKADIFRDIQSRISEELDASGLESIRAAMSFHYTSIFDHSIFEAISKVVQKHVKSHFLATIEALVNSLLSNCRMEKAYLFDTKYMFYIASDTQPGDLKSYETLSDYLDVVRDITQVYGWREHDPNAEERYEDFHMESLVSMDKKGSRYLYVKAMNKFLTLACIMGEDKPAERQSIIEYNVRIFQDGLNQVLDELKLSREKTLQWMWEKEQAKVKK